MSIIITRALQDKAAWFFGTILFLIIGTLGYTYILSLDNPIKVVTDPISPEGVIAGGKYELCRVVEYSRKATVNVGRSLTQIRDGKIHTISYPSFSLTRKKGRYFICRDIQIPSGLHKGIWTVHTYLTIHTPPFWKTNIETKKFQIEVLKSNCK